MLILSDQNRKERQEMTDGNCKSGKSEQSVRSGRGAGGGAEESLLFHAEGRVRRRGRSIRLRKEHASALHRRAG